MPRLVILPTARTDLIEIGDFIAADNPERAASFVAEIEAKDKVQVVRVLHGAWDLPRAFEP